MSALRRMSGHSHLLAWVLGLAIALRLLVPAGWMPVFAADGVRLELCGGVQPRPPAVSNHHGDHGAAAHAGHDAGKHKSPAPPDQPCAFAVAATPWLSAADGPALLPAVPAPVVAAVPLAAAIGHGLAAPPPPSTGPPFLS